MNWSLKRKCAVALVSMSVAFIGFSIRQLGTMTPRACQAMSGGAETSVAMEGAYFPVDYRVARQRFLDATRASGGSIESIQNPNVGPDDEPLFMDVAYFGLRDESKVIVVSSGTHGVEGFAGSGIQTRLLQEGIASRLPLNVGLMMIHGINPYGMAHWRRVNEDNVDLNRNFRDHSTPYPNNPGYEALADVIAPASISFWNEVESWSSVGWLWATAREDAVRAVTEGQYSHPEGLFYGGSADTWSNTTVKTIVGEYLPDASQVVVVDFHTGLGEYASAEVILNVPEDSPAHRRALDIWGPGLTRTTVTGDSVSAHLEASLKLALPRMLPGAEVTAVSLEFGTVPLLDAFKALRGENWLHHNGGGEHPREQELKACLLRAFHPAALDWEESVWEQGKEVINRAMASLAS